MLSEFKQQVLYRSLVGTEYHIHLLATSVHVVTPDDLFDVLLDLSNIVSRSHALHPLLHSAGHRFGVLWLARV